MIPGGTGPPGRPPPRGGGPRHPPQVPRPVPRFPPRIPRAMAYSAAVAPGSVPVRAACAYHRALDFGVRASVA
ncbi:hypothetical protein Save01_04637 [Streptomyces avermitilis]